MYLSDSAQISNQQLSEVLAVDPRKVHLKGLKPSITDDNVKAYIQSIISDKAKVKYVQLGSNGNALVTFVDQPAGKN
jgi:hypothetical protein